MTALIIFSCFVLLAEFLCDRRQCDFSGELHLLTAGRPTAARLFDWFHPSDDQSRPQHRSASLGALAQGKLMTRRARLDA